MSDILLFQRITELKRTKNELERKLNVKIILNGRTVTIKGDSLDEYEASLVLDAMNFGFSARRALLLKEESKIFRILNIKRFTKKRDLKTVRARIIGKKGKTKETIENITGAHLVIKDNEIGIIASADTIEDIVTALIALIKGTKQSNTYHYLEKLNKKDLV
ncbi:MAG: hypothetical protein AABX83_03710 [Nanoarchaeota archaeon]